MTEILSKPLTESPFFFVCYYHHHYYLFIYLFIPFSQGLLDPILALNLSRYLVKELHPVPWAVTRRSAKCLWGVFSKPHKLLYKVQRLS